MYRGKKVALSAPDGKDLLRFNAYVVKTPDSCWGWSKGISSEGYARSSKNTSRT